MTDTKQDNEERTRPSNPEPEPTELEHASTEPPEPPKQEEPTEEQIQKVVRSLANKAMNVSRSVEEAGALASTFREISAIVKKTNVPADWLRRTILYMVPPRWQETLSVLTADMSRNELLVLVALIPAVWAMGYRRGARQ